MTTALEVRDLEDAMRGDGVGLQGAGVTGKPCAEGSTVVTAYRSGTF